MGKNLQPAKKEYSGYLPYPSTDRVQHKVNYSAK